MLLKLLREIRTADIISDMKSTIKKRTWKSIYRLLDRVSPIDGDCGRLCGSVCCTCGSKDNTKGEDELLADYLENRVFGGNVGNTVQPDAVEAAGYDVFMRDYAAGLEIERTAVRILR